MFTEDFLESIYLETTLILVSPKIILEFIWRDLPLLANVILAWVGTRTTSHDGYV